MKNFDLKINKKNKKYKKFWFLKLNSQQIELLKL